MTVYDVADKMNGWNYCRVSDGVKVYHTDENGYEPIPERVGESEVLGIYIEGNTLILEIEELEDEEDEEDE